MKKQFGAAFLLAGTAIGSGMISLPMVLAKFGIFNSCLLMAAFAGLTYLTALIRSDLNLNFHPEATLSEVGAAFNCPNVGKFGDFLLKLLSFALMAAYLFGGASIVNAFLGNPFSNSFMITIFSFVIALLFLCASELIVHANRILFLVMFGIFIFLVLILLQQTSIHFIPRSEEITVHQWTMLVPIIFTSFGFQGSIHSMTKFLKNDRKMIKNACFWGSLIPAIVYTIWTSAILLVVANTDVKFFELMLEGKATDVGELVCVLSKAASTSSIQAIVWIVSILAIMTSIFGVGLALLEIFQRELHMHRVSSITLVVFVPALIAIIVPNAFIKILNISGIILAMIAIIVPVIIFLNMRKIGKFKNELLLKNNIVLFMVFSCGIGIIVLGLMDFLNF